jgi:antitoxin (DNA-binding transcriptional repressor) of toxin-antitoxin stability system
MSPTVTLEEAQADLEELIASLAPGEEIVITEDEQVVARLIGARGKLVSRLAPRSGNVATDFDPPLLTRRSLEERLGKGGILMLAVLFAIITWLLMNVFMP